jgi:hypothetical protein
MPLLVWRFITLMLTALSMGLAFCHLLERPARLGWDGALWTTVTAAPGGLYRGFGTIGAVLEVGAVLAAIVLVVLARARRAAFLGSLVGAVLLVASLVAWWVLVAPVNAQIATWSAAALPADWQAWRDQWENGHAVRAVLQIAGLAALILSVLADRQQDPLAMSADAAAKRLGVPSRAMRR